MCDWQNELFSDVKMRKIYTFISPGRVEHKKVRWETQIESSNFTNFKISFLNKIHEFLRILKLSILKFINSNYHINRRHVPTNSSSQRQHITFELKILWMSTIQDSLTRQQFSMITSSLLQSLRIACSFTVFHSVVVLNCPLFPFNSCLSVIDCIVLNCS